MLKDAQILKNYLRNNGITQGQLADKLGMTRQNLVFHLSKDRFSLDFSERLRQIGIDLSSDKYEAAKSTYINQGFSPSIPAINSDQGNTLLLAINSATYANTELLCEVLAAITKVPIAEVRAKANRLTHEKMRLVEQVLDRLIEVPSGGEDKKSKKN